MGNTCDCHQMPTSHKAQPDSFMNLLDSNSKQYELSIQKKHLKLIEHETKNIQQSEIQIATSHLEKSSHPPSLIRSSQFNHKLVVDPPSEYNQEMLQNLQNMSQVPSDFFNNVDMSVYFRDNKTQKGRLSNKFSFKDAPKISIQSKTSREDDFADFHIKNQQNPQEKDDERLKPSIIIEQSITGSRSEFKQKKSTIHNEQVPKTISKSMIRPKIDSQLLVQKTKRLGVSTLN